MLDTKSNCYVHMGRFGDIMILLPGWKHEYDTIGRKPVVMVSEEFASIFDGVSYVQPWPVRLRFCADAAIAKATAEKHFEKVIVPRWWDVGKPPPPINGHPVVKVSFRGRDFTLSADDWVSHQVSQWRAAGFDDVGMKDWPLIFDRRVARREAELAKAVFKTDKPKLLLNLRGVSSPFAAVPEVLNKIEPLKRKFEFVDISSVRAERVFDLLGLMDRSTAMITVDTATLHLAHASKIPYVGLIQTGERGSMPKGNCILAVRYENAPEMADKIFDAVAATTKPEPVQIMAQPAKTRARTCWMLPNDPNPRIAIAYLYPCDARETFMQFATRWVESYKRFVPKLEHDVIVYMSNGTPNELDYEIFKGVPVTFSSGYEGGGWDIGHFQHIAKVCDHDLVVFMNSRSYLWREGWLEPFIEAAKRYGLDGLYGSMASYESCAIPGTFPAPNPHIRTSCFVTNPKILRRFPYVVDSREQSFKFESGEWNVSDWYGSQGFPVKMVTADGVYDRKDWRKPPNIFRRGDQSNCLIADRHTLIFSQAGEAERRMLSARADGITGLPLPPVKRIGPVKTITIVAATSLNASGHAKAIERTARMIPHPCQKLLISSTKVTGFSGKQVPLPEPWAKNGKWTIDDMCDFLLTGLHKYITTDIAIIVHDDGYALNKGKWTDDFLNYDYIGGPWPRAFRWTKPNHRVGNGGFSLRSKRWLEHASKLLKIPPGTSEDVYCGVHHVQHFLKMGYKIAPLGLAMRWSFEHRIEEFPDWKLSESFGYHGLTTQDPARRHLRLV